MKKPYKVLLKEVHTQEVHVEAHGLDDAITKVLDGEGDYVGGSEYCHPLDDSSQPWPYHKAEEL